MNRVATLFLSLVDRWIGPIADPRLRNRARFVAAVPMLMAPVISAVFVLHLFIGVPASQLAIASLDVSLFLVLALVRYHRFDLAAGFFVVGLAGTANGIAMLTGGPQSGGFALNAVVLVYAAVTLPRAVLPFLLALVMGAGSLHALRGAEAIVQLEPQLHLIPWSISLTLVVVLTSTLVWLWHASFDELQQTTLSRDELTRILDGVGEQVFVTDAQRRVTMINDAVRRAGWTEDVLGRRLDSIVEGAVSLGANPTRTSVRRGDGSRFPAMVTRRDVPGAIVWAAANITALEQASEALRSAHQQATAASDAKTRFLANMSHELRTPLNAIIGYSELLQDDIEDEDALQDLGRIGTAADTLLTLINGVLDLTKVEAGHVKPNLQQVSLDELVDPTLELIQPPATARGLALRVVRPDDAPLVHTDPVRLRQVLLNLLSNAVKFTDQGEVELRISCWSRASLPWMRLEVIDTGSGMTADELKVVFEPFVQASVGEEHGGTGLGLSISKSFVEMLGGQLYAESTLGEGSRFVVEVPTGPMRLLTPATAHRKVEEGESAR